MYIISRRQQQDSRKVFYEKSNGRFLLDSRIYTFGHLKWDKNPEKNN